MVEAAVHIVFFLPPDSTDFSPLKKDFAILKKKQNSPLNKTRSNTFKSYGTFFKWLYWQVFMCCKTINIVLQD